MQAVVWSMFWETTAAEYSAEDVAERGDPCPGPWTGSLQPSRTERTSFRSLHSCELDPEGSLHHSFPMLWRVLEDLSSARGSPAVGKPQVLFPAS